MLQIIKCSNLPCCRPLETNYSDFYPQRFLPSPTPVSVSKNGLKIDYDKHTFRSVFQWLHLPQKLGLNTYFEKYCTSLGGKDAKGETVVERCTCQKCNLYYLTITAMTSHKRICGNKCQQQNDIMSAEGFNGNDEDNLFAMIMTLGKISLSA